MYFRVRDMMLVHFFDMKDMNSAWNSLCLGQQADENCDSRSSLTNQRRQSSSPLHCNAIVQATATSTYSHKHPELDACNDLSPSTDNKQSSCVFHSPAQAIYNTKTKLSRLSSICQSGLSDLGRMMPSGSQTTRSEPATRSNSIDCENDISKLPVYKTNHSVEPSRLRLDLIVPNGKRKIIKNNKEANVKILTLKEITMYCFSTFRQ